MRLYHDVTARSFYFIARRHSISSIARYIGAADPSEAFNRPKVFLILCTETGLSPWMDTYKTALTGRLGGSWQEVKLCDIFGREKN